MCCSWTNFCFLLLNLICENCVIKLLLDTEIIFCKSVEQFYCFYVKGNQDDAYFRVILAAVSSLAVIQM